MIDGVEVLKKHKNIPPKSRTEGKPLFGDDGNLKGIEGQEKNKEPAVEDDYPVCWKCETNKYVVKNGHRNNIQRYTCKNCNKTFQEDYTRKHDKINLMKEVVKLKDDGFSLRDIATLINEKYESNISYGTVKNWLDEYQGIKEPEEETPKQVKNPETSKEHSEPTAKTPIPTPKTCKYCDNPISNRQKICHECKEKRFLEVWEEILEPLLEKQEPFIKKDVEDIDFPMTLNNSLAWYIENNMLTMEKDGRTNTYRRPTEEEKRERAVPGITKKCRTCEEIRPVSEFYKQKRSYDGYSYDCIMCDKLRNQDRPRRKPEKIDQIHHLEGLLINDMEKQHRKNQPIKIHLHLLNELEEYVEGHPDPLCGGTAKSEPMGEVGCPIQ